ncbi:MAG: 50S ribosomal protein L13 [bacterium]|nr:50S ribosomal protein L13 [bacterium]
MYQRTVFQKKEIVSQNRRWVLIDAAGQTLGRLATRVATLLRGKHRPDWTPHVDGGDCVVLINAEKVVFTGQKLDQKMYYRHSGYPGHLKETSARRLLETHPERVLKLAVRGMMPKNKLGRAMLLKLKIYAGDKHPHAAQNPETITFDKA